MIEGRSNESPRSHHEQARSQAQVARQVRRQPRQASQRLIRAWGSPANAKARVHSDAGFRRAQQALRRRLGAAQLLVLQSALPSGWCSAHALATGAAPCHRAPGTTSSLIFSLIWCSASQGGHSLRCAPMRNNSSSRQLAVDVLEQLVERLFALALRHGAPPADAPLALAPSSDLIFMRYARLVS